MATRQPYTPNPLHSPPSRYGGLCALVFDAKGDVIPQWAWLVRYQNGEWVEVSFQVSLPLLLKRWGS